MNWLWPQSLHQETSVEIRAGRVAHWFFLGGAVWVFVGGIFLSQGESDRGAVIMFYTIGAVFSAFFGRAIRYILADE